MLKNYTKIANTSIANSISDMVFVNFFENNKLSNFIEVNESACKILLYTEEEFSHLNPYKIIPNKLIKQLNKELVKLQVKKHAYLQLDLLAKNGRKIPVEISSDFIEEQGKQLIISVVRNSLHNRTKENKLKSRIKQLHDLASHLQASREERRSAIARELHDELGQLLTALKIQIVLLSNKVKKTKDITKRFTDLVDIVDQTIKSIQQITSQLRPQLLDELGLITAIEWQAEEFQKLTGIICKYSLPADNININKDKETAIFRILQEALTNVARHSFAKRVSIFLKKTGENLILEVTDNGDGISLSQIKNPSSLGLLGIRERVTLFGGRMEIHGIKNEGTNIKIKIPLDNN
jgi:PAS domain S-box-containing protein